GGDFGFRISDFGSDGNDQTATDDARPLQIRNPKSEIRNEEVLDLLDSLVEQSLVLVEEQEAGLRYGMLETVREYAVRKLRQAGEEAGARDRHLAYFLQRAEAMSPALSGPGPEAALDFVESEIGNCRAALAWSGSQLSVASCQLPVTV